MDRRHFFKTLLLSPLLSPLILSSRTMKMGAQLYLITDTPHRYISIILQELENHGLIIEGRSFTFLNSSPFARNLQRILIKKGWKYIPIPSKARISFSFSHLHQKVSPSFTLINEGNILDIRSKKLALLWREMNKSLEHSSCLTIASFKKQRISNPQGSDVLVYVDGRPVDKISLSKTALTSYSTHNGKVTVRVKKGEAWVKDSSCVHKICCLSPPVSLQGERIICAPNHILLDIKGPSFVDTVIG